MIFLVTNKRDITTDFVVLELQRRDLPFMRLNSEELPASKMTVRPGAPGNWSLSLGDDQVQLGDVTGAYYRRPGTPEPVGTPEPATEDYIVAEWSAIMRSLSNVLEGRWLNSPFAILRAEDKPRQLELALALGFDVPETLIGNDLETVAPFVAAGERIAKPLRNALIERGPIGEVLFTSRLGALGAEDGAAVAAAPVIYQREVRKAFDIRATVIGKRTFAVAIHSQSHEETEVDWRRGARLDVEHEVIELPKPLAARCVALTEALGLRYGAIDLIRDTTGRDWFLEINPNGQWAWIERRTGVPLAAAIVDALLDPAA